MGKLGIIECIRKDIILTPTYLMRGSILLTLEEISIVSRGINEPLAFLKTHVTVDDESEPSP